MDVDQYGHYQQARQCERDDCDYQTTSRTDYWNHRLGHEKNEEEES